MECDFDAAIPGAIYGAELYQADIEGRIKPGIYDPTLKTHAVLDLGFTDDTAIWWFQVGKELRLVDCYSTHGMPISHYNEVLRAKPYTYGEWLWLPHDARAKSLQTGRSIVEQVVGLGWSPRIVPELGLTDGIQASRLSLRTVFIDSKCKDGLEALRQYQREYDADKKCFRDHPRHDWTSHYADAFRYACLVWREEFKAKAPDDRIRGITIGQNEVTLNELWETAPKKSRRI